MSNVTPTAEPFQRFQGSVFVEGTPPASAIVVVVAFLASSALATILTTEPNVIVTIGAFVSGFVTGNYYRHLSHRRPGGTRE